LRKRRGGGEKLGEVGFLELNRTFLFEDGGERGLGFIYSFFITFVLCKRFVIFLTFEGGTRHGISFTFFLKKILKGKQVGRGFFFLHFVLLFHYLEVFLLLFVILEGEGGP
jgi:hypothetical protein